jgi:transcriptional regulator with XRE-family HTH domain
MDEIRKQLADNLSSQRKRAGLSQETLAERCDLDRTEISLLECGKRFPRLDTLVRLSRALELSSPAELLDGIR